ncbi:MAG: alpha/beta fold hydrolase [Erysipelotrichaceae bacterium]|nr:alpha/beta fold hydrolase [Erysipelotrichaceae bacterium]
MKTKYRIIQKDFYRDFKKIYGEVYYPEADYFPLAIFSHGLGGVHEGSRDFAEVLAQNGIAVCIFDFIGGSYQSKSDGKTTEMSVLSEAEDLEAVIDELKKDERITRVFLAGKSQGAFVSTIVASRRPEEIAGLIGLYPGYILSDAIEEEMRKFEEIPETYELLWLKVGSVYIKDLLKTPIYEMMKEYNGDVLLIHGDKDKIVTTESVEKAKNCFPNCELIILKGAEHGFHGPERTEVIDIVLNFILKRI